MIGSKIIMSEVQELQYSKLYLGYRYNSIYMSYGKDKDLFISS